MMKIAIVAAAISAVWAIEDSSPTRRIVAVLLSIAITSIASASWADVRSDALDQVVEQLRWDMESGINDLRIELRDLSQQVVMRRGLLIAYEEALRNENEMLDGVAAALKPLHSRDDSETETPPA